MVTNSRFATYFFFPFGIPLRMSSKLMFGLCRTNGFVGGSTGITPAGNGRASSPGWIDVRLPCANPGELVRGTASGDTPPGLSVDPTGWISDMDPMDDWGAGVGAENSEAASSVVMGDPICCCCWPFSAHCAATCQQWLRR